MSIRFYKDHEVRAVWDEKKSAWWFSIVDIVGDVTDSPNPRKYWSVLKTRLKRAGNELTTRCSQLKMTAAEFNVNLVTAFSVIVREPEAAENVQKVAKTGQKVELSQVCPKLSQVDLHSQFGSSRTSGTSECFD